LAGVILPTEVQINVAGAKLSPARMAVVLLLLPALFTLCRKGRCALLCDFLVCATVSWIVIATVDNVGWSGLSAAAGGEILEFLGGYLVARAFFLNPSSLDTFIRVLRVFAVIAIIFGIADHISERYVVHDAVGSLFPAWGGTLFFRGGSLRAVSTFDHAICFGLFCAFSAAILLYWEMSLLRKRLSVSICFLGCLLSLSSVALMTFTIALGAYLYDRLLKRFPWRWPLFWSVVSMMVIGIFLASNNPLGWVLRHLTFDPQTGYFRILIWDVASDFIMRAPFTGYSYALYNNAIIDGSVDAVWLVFSLRFGLPMAILFFLTNVAAFFPTRQTSRNGTNDSNLDRMKRAFTTVLLLFMFAGLTVHFWNYMLMFWGLCIGIRASMRELSIPSRSGRNYQLALVPTGA
jgi:hypothetical protein